MSFTAFIDRVDGRKRTLSLYNVDVPKERIDGIEAFFRPQQVQLRRSSTDDGCPRNFAVLHENEEFIAASGIEELAVALDFEKGIYGSETVADVEYTEILRHVDNTTFSGYDKRRMIIASREIEMQAWNAGRGQLHVGFQRLPLLSSQDQVYSKLADSAVGVHVYGRPDGVAPEWQGLSVYPSDADEIADSWFVVFDGNGDDERKCAFLGTEVRDDEYTGFWTYDAAIVDELLRYITTTYGDEA